MTEGRFPGSEEHSRGFRRIIRLLIWLVILPTALLLVLAILMLVYWQSERDLVFSVLAMTLVGCLVTGAVLALVFLRREANLSKLQLDFVSKVSHELRTPLTSIRMFTEMLEDNDDPDDTAVCLHVLKVETERLTERIERLLDWGRMEAGRRIYDLKEDEPQAIVEAALEAFDASHLGQSPAVDVIFEEQLPTFPADRGALVDALVNLLSNAMKYSRDAPQISIRLWQTGRNVRISVRDRGIGIPRREHHRIFQKFYRANDLLSRDVEGSGLGLAIVRHVAMGHGGRVEVDSEPGQGSTFTLVLPIGQNRRVSAVSPLGEPTVAES